MHRLEELMRRALDRQASDLHLSADDPPVLRIHGVLEREEGPPLGAEWLAQVTWALTPPEKHEELADRGEVDFSYHLPDGARFRVNIFRHRGSYAVAMRTIPAQVQSLAELGLPQGVPEVLAGLCDKPHGLVLVTGPTGSGKSTTLAAMIDTINRSRHCHIITLEDPIEFLHTPRRALIHQREVGSDTGSFARGLRAALRQDPDVILVGEMRDLETIQIALEAAETGHLVFATLHTNGAPATIERVVDVFPAAQQGQVRIQLAGALQAVVSQRLFRRRDQTGRVVACEVLLATTAVRNLVREQKTHQLMSVIQTGGRKGMLSMEASVKELLRRGAITQEDYQQFAQEMGTNLGGSGGAGGSLGAAGGQTGLGGPGGGAGSGAGNGASSGAGTLPAGAVGSGAGGPGTGVGRGVGSGAGSGAGSVAATGSNLEAALRAGAEAFEHVSAARYPSHSSHPSHPGRPGHPGPRGGSGRKP